MVFQIVDGLQYIEVCHGSRFECVDYEVYRNYEVYRIRVGASYCNKSREGALEHFAGLCKAINRFFYLRKQILA